MKGMQIIAKTPEGKEIKIDLPFKMAINTKWEKWRAITFWNKEPETIEWIKSFEPNTVFWDVGANIGVYSLYCAALHPRISIHAFEPLWANYKTLRNNVFDNNLNMQIVMHHVGLSDCSKLAGFGNENDVSGSSGRQISAVGPEIEVYTGDMIAQAYRSWPDYLKIDVDGLEYEILEGMYDILNYEYLKSILIEMNKNNDGIEDILIQAGFTQDNRFNQFKNRESDNNVIWTREFGLL